MATRLSKSFARTALRLVNVFGKDYVIRRETQGAKDPDKPTLPGPVTIEDFILKAAITNFETEQIDGTQVLRGDLKVVVAQTDALPEEFLPGDFFIDGAKRYNIIPPVKILSVNGITVAQVLQVRR